MARYRVTAEGLAVRAEPKLTGAIVGELHRDEEVDVISVSGDGYWFKVNRGALSGWSSHKFLVSAETPEEETDEGLAWMAVAMRELGVKEYTGAGDNPRIVQYLSSTTLPAPARNNDETHWCSAFVNWCVEQAGYAGTDSAWARSWLSWGKKAKRPRRGCIVVLERPCAEGGCGHVGFYIGVSGAKVKLLGGNQSDSVCISEYPRSRVLSYRVP